MNKFFKLLLLLLIGYWSYYLLTVPMPWIFIDGVNLLFHEAGHILFSLFGQFLYVLGGSLTQILIPLGIGMYFLCTRQFLAATFGLFWLGDNFINVSVYIKDSRAMILPLIGGDTSGHDWHWLLTTLHLLPYDQQIGGVVWLLGALCLLTSIGICIYLIMLDFVPTDQI
jgi:hypothetical protein